MIFLLCTGTSELFFYISYIQGTEKYRAVICIKHLGKLGRRRGWQRPERNDKFWSWTDLWPSEAFAVPRPVADHSHHFGDDDHGRDCDFIMLMIMTMKMMTRIMVMMMVSDHSSNEQFSSLFQSCQRLTRWFSTVREPRPCKPLAAFGKGKRISQNVGFQNGAHRAHLFCFVAGLQGEQYILFVVLDLKRTFPMILKNSPLLV